MSRGAALAALGILTILSACAGSSDSEGGDEEWGVEAENVVSLLADAYDVADPYETARFFSAGGTLDLGIWGLPVTKTPEEAVSAIVQLWFQEPGRAEVEPEHLFVSLDGALVWWWAYDDGGGQQWVQSYAFGPTGRATSRAFRNAEIGLEIASPSETMVAELAARYVAAWDTKDRAELATIYAQDVFVRDEVRGQEWHSFDEVAANLADAPPVQPGPAPHFFVYEAGNLVDAIVLVQLGGDCPMLEARRWVVEGSHIVSETRFTHVPSAQRCLSDLPAGWWSTFELPPDLMENVTWILDIGGSLVDLVNAEPSHEEFTRWMFDRYTEAEIGMPDTAAIWFPPSPDCDQLGGLAIEADDRYEGRHTVVVCFAHDRLASATSDSGWMESAAGYGLHELAHIWMLDHLTDETRDAFNQMSGTTQWRDASVKWSERGVERAAFTIAWGLAGTTDARWPIFFPGESCAELATRYELLTGRQPLTSCGEDGWRQ